MEKGIAKLQDQLPEMPKNMRAFSLAMRSLYADKSVSSSVENGAEFIRLRDETRNNAVVYLKHIMPITEKCVGYLQEFFENYEGLEFDEWKSSLKEIVKEVDTYKQGCHALIKIHEAQLSELKKKEDQAQILCKKFGALESKYDEEINELRASAKTKNDWAFALAFIPIVGNIASIILLANAGSNLADATARGEQQSIALYATKVVSNTLVPALKNFINGLEIISGFFEIVEQELEQLERKGDRALENLDAIENAESRHYKLMKKKAGEIKGECRKFYATLPAIRSDFMAIPEEGTDQNYVDRWLAKQKQIIRENCNDKLSTRFLNLSSKTE